MEQARIIQEIAPPLPPDWSVGTSYESPPLLTYHAFYQNLKRILSSLGYCTYDMCLRLDACLALNSAADLLVHVPLFAGSSPALYRLINAVGTRRNSAPAEPRRARRALARHANDARWMLRSADDHLPRMPRIEERDGLLQKLHYTALRETAASEVPALNLLEYDGLPKASDSAGRVVIS